MAPPPLPPRRQPPPLPQSHGGPARTLNPQFGTPKHPEQFDLTNVSRLSTRNVTRTTGNIFNQWIGCNSTNVNKFRCDPDMDLDGKKLGTGTILIEFVNGSVYEYPNRKLGDFLDLFESSSKGRFTYYEVRGEGPSIEGVSLWQPYRKIKPAWRSASAIAKIVALREPKGNLAERRYTKGGKRQSYGKGGKYIGRRKTPPPLSGYVA